MSENYHWTPMQIQELTMYQAMIYAGAFCPEDGRIKLSPEQSHFWEARNGV